jgi:hypothetical protein
VDAVSGERGQALVLAAALLGVAAVAVVGLRAASDRLLDAVHDERAGEAAAAAAGIAVGDLLFARARAIGRDLARDEVAALVAEPVVREAAHAAAFRLARQHGRDGPADVRVIAFGLEVEVHVVLTGRTHVALIAAAP